MRISGWHDAPRGAFHAAFLLLAVALAYANALHGAFQFDDFGTVVGNPVTQSWGAWWRDLGHGIRPLLKLSFLLNHQLSSAPAGYIAFNLVIHALNTLLVWRLLRRWLGDAPLLALAAALLWALHPAQTEAVTYISGRSVSLSTLFVLLTVLGYERWREGARTLPATVLAYGLAVAVKETAAITPLLLLLVELRRGTPWLAAWRRVMPWLFFTALFALLAIALTRYAGFWSVSAATRAAGANLIAQVDGIAYLLAVFVGAFAPNIDPAVPAATALTPARALLALTWLALLGWALWRARQRATAWGWLWFFVALIPTNSVFARLDIANDRQLYLASLGLVFALAIALRVRPRLGVALLLALALAAGCATHRRNADYASELALWQSSVAVAPSNVRALHNLGQALARQGKTTEARCLWARALAQQPDYAPTQRALMISGVALSDACPLAAAESVTPR